MMDLHAPTPRAAAEPAEQREPAAASGNLDREDPFGHPKSCACGITPPCRFCFMGDAGELDDLDDTTLFWR